jgi:hypothetical protein
MRSWSRVAVLLAAASVLPFGSGAVTDTETRAHLGEIIAGRTLLLFYLLVDIFLQRMQRIAVC